MTAKEHGLLSGVMKMIWSSVVLMFAKLVSLIKPTKLYILKW